MADETKADSMASQGGKARAAKMTKTERSESARKAAEARWGGVIPQAKYQGEIPLGDVTIPCAVLEDKKTRLITQRGVFVALGRNKNPNTGHSAIDGKPGFLAANNLDPFISDELRRSWHPVRFRPMDGNSGGTDGNIAIGYRATILPLVCRVYMDADAAGVLTANQKHIAAHCRMILGGLATVGIASLIDDATGFTPEREREELANILMEFVAKEIRAWVPTFDADFYKMIFRLRGWNYTGSSKRTPLLGKYTNDLVYRRLAPGLLDELQRVNPKDDKGNRKGKHHQWLTEHRGHPGLIKHISRLTGWGDMCSNWDEFMKVVNERAEVQRGPSLFDESFREDD